MSLINQALRKAQRDRTPSRMGATTDDTSIPRVTHISATGMKPGLMIGLVAGIALLLGLVAGLTIVVLKKEPAPVQQTALLAQPTPTTAQTPPAPAAQPIQAISAPAPTQTIEPDSPSVLEELRLARAAAEAKAAADAEAAQKAEAAALATKQAAAAKAAAKPSQDIINWLGQAKVTGVRLSDSVSKVILNNKAYAVGETVHFGLGLKVLIVQEARVLFIDANGKKYMKRL